MYGAHDTDPANHLRYRSCAQRSGYTAWASMTIDQPYAGVRLFALNNPLQVHSMVNKHISRVGATAYLLVIMASLHLYLAEKLRATRSEVLVKFLFQGSCGGDQDGETWL